MPTIDSPDEAQSVARLIQGGQITGAARDTALQALRDFDTKQSTPQTGAQHFAAALNIGKQHPFTAGIGMLENAWSGIAGGAGSLADAVTLSDPGTHNWAYRPQTDAGQQIAALGAQETGKAGQLYDRVAGTGPLATTLKERLPEALAATSTVAGGTEAALRGVPAVTRMGARLVMPKPLPSAQSVVDRMASTSPQSMGAASASPSLANASPELQQAISRAAQQTGGAINPEVLGRHLEADSLPVRIQLTEGQATQNPSLLSQEQNVRGKYPQLVDRFGDQNGQLVQNIQAIRDQVGPDVFSTNPTEHGDTLISAYRAKDAAAQQATGAKYQALRDANGGQFPVDAKGLLDNASAQLHQQLLFDHAPKAVMSTLGRLADSGSMTFENFESLRTNLARIQRSLSADGNEKAAAGIIRNAMEELPLAPGASTLKPLADSARGAARAQFQALEADPAYKAAVRGTVDPDKFVRRFVIGGARDDVAQMRSNLADSPAASQTLGVAVLDHLRDAAGISPNLMGNFSSARYNRALTALDPKLRLIVDPDTADQLEKLGNVARYTMAQPRGAFVNNSNTLVASLGKYGASALEGAANVAAKGIPVGTWGRRAIQNVSAGRMVRQALAPGAGLTRLRPAQPVPGLMSAPPAPRGIPGGGGLMGGP